MHGDIDVIDAYVHGDERRSRELLEQEFDRLLTEHQDLLKWLSLQVYQLSSRQDVAYGVKQQWIKFSAATLLDVLYHHSKFSEITSTACLGADTEVPVLLSLAFAEVALERGEIEYARSFVASYLKIKGLQGNNSSINKILPAMNQDQLYGSLGRMIRHNNQAELIECFAHYYLLALPAPFLQAK